MNNWCNANSIGLFRIETANLAQLRTRKRTIVTRPFPQEVWERDYVAETGMAWSELVNNKCHFWMVRQALHDFTYVAIVCHVGNPRR